MGQFRVCPSVSFGPSCSGGLLDTEGNLVGIITLKSPGKQAYHYYMATEWVSALFAQPSVAITSKNELPFWGTQAQLWRTL